MKKLFIILAALALALGLTGTVLAAWRTLFSGGHPALVPQPAATA